MNASNHMYSPAYDTYGGAAPQHLAEQAQPPTTSAGDTGKGIPSVDEIRRSQAALKPFDGIRGNLQYALDFVQQPQRARMCGFGDKDRRPITPAPVTRIKVMDLDTCKEVPINEIEFGKFIVTIDLWSADGLQECNLVRHTTSTPSISSTAPASFVQVEQNTAHVGFMPGAPHNPGFSGPGYNPGVHQYATPPGYGPGPYGAPNGYGAQTMGFPQNQYRPDWPGAAHAGGMHYQPQVYARDDAGIPNRMSLSGNQGPQGMFTRNLIGNLAAVSNRLADPFDKIGLFAIHQDLSVRTEGDFRLRASFVDLSNVGPEQGDIKKGKAPVLASCYSDVFTVYSAKKFPGVCDSTLLSKCFAHQGIKIPIRKDGANGKDGDDGGGDYD